MLDEHLSDDFSYRYTIPLQELFWCVDLVSVKVSSFVEEVVE